MSVGRHALPTKSVFFNSDVGEGGEIPRIGYAGDGVSKFASSTREHPNSR